MRPTTGGSAADAPAPRPRGEDLAVEGIWLDRDAATPLGAQLAEGLRAAIAAGRFAAGDRLPSTRRIARELGGSRGVATDALELLVADGFAEARGGAGTFVAAPVTASAAGNAVIADGVRWQVAVPDVPVDVVDPALVVDLTSNRPSTDAFPMEAWRAAWRRVLRRAPHDDYADAAGDPALRFEVARHAARARGVPATRDDVVITNGALQAFELIGRAVVPPGGTVAVEDPGFRYHSGTPVQQALATLLERGDFARHVARMRGVYAERRAALVAGFGPLPAGVRLRGLAAGMHAVVEVPDGATATRAAAAARAEGVGVTTLERYYLGPATVAGLVVGYGHQPAECCGTRAGCWRGRCGGRWCPLLDPSARRVAERLGPLLEDGDVRRVRVEPVALAAR